MASTLIAGRPSRRIALGVVALFLLGLPLAPPVLALSPAGAQTDARTNATENTDEPVPQDIVVLVDESGSLSEADVEEEAKAAATIAQSVLTPGSRVTVVGFGSNNGEPGQVAAREVCAPTLIDREESRQYLADCSLDIQRREKAEGNDTDHAEALGKALEYLEDDGSPRGSVGLVFMLTDGALDVGDSPQYGDTERRDENAAALIDEHLDTAREHGTQIWPLGFGGRIDRSQLDAFATGGAQEGCSELEVATPVSRVVQGSGDVLRSFQEALASATCSVVGETDSDNLTGGDSTTLRVDVPLIATDGALQVIKNNPAIQAEYVDPRGRSVDLTNPEHEGTGISLTGANGPVEVLRLVDPMPGTWEVRLTSPAGTAEELVSASIQWTGFINTHVGIENAEKPDERTVLVYIRTRRGPVTDPEALSALDFSADAVFSDGSTAEISLRDDGEGPDRGEGDGQYTGTLNLPEGSGTETVTVNSMVQGTGIADDVQEHVYTPDEGAGSLRPLITFTDPPEEVWAGERIEGDLTVENVGTETEEVALALSLPEGMSATVEQEDDLFAPGNSESGFTIHVEEGHEPGSGALNVQAVSSDGKVLTTSPPLALTMRDEPGPLERHWPIWTAGLVLMALAVLALSVARSRQRSTQNVQGLSAELHQGDRVVGPRLNAPSRWSSSFSFVIRETEGTGPQLAYVGSEGKNMIHRVVRTSVGVRLHPPQGKPQELRQGEKSRPLAGNLTVSLHDTRSPRRTPPVSSHPRAGASHQNGRTNDDGTGRNSTTNLLN